MPTASFLVDATADGNPIGTVTRTTPKFSRDYPPTLTAHDIGVKDLLDAFYMQGGSRDVILYAITIDPQQPISMELSETCKKARGRGGRADRGGVERGRSVTPLRDVTERMAVCSIPPGGGLVGRLGSSSRPSSLTWATRLRGRRRCMRRSPWRPSPPGIGQCRRISPLPSCPRRGHDCQA